MEDVINGNILIGLRLPIYNIFAKRKRAAENAEKPVIYTQDQLTEQFRVQVVWILRDLIGFPNEVTGPVFWMDLLHSFGSKPATRLRQSWEDST